MDNKKCPICNIVKPVSDFNSYFSKERKKRRCQNYCKCCEKTEKRRRSAIYYQDNKEGRKQYAIKYRADPKNKVKLKKRSQYFKVKYRSELKDCYVVEQASNCLKIPVNEVRLIPNAIEDYRGIIQIKRIKNKINKLINEKQDKRSA